MVYFYELKQGRYEWAESVLLASHFKVPPEEFRRLIEETIAETPEWKMSGSRYHPDVEYLVKRLMARTDYDFKRVQPRLRALCKDERWKQEFEIVLVDDLEKEAR